MTSNEEKEVNQINDKDSKVKSFAFDTTKIVSVAILLTVLTIVFVFSLIPVGFDPSKAFSDPKWWGNFGISSALIIFGMFYGLTEGTIFLKQYVFGAFQVARTAFLDTVDEIFKLNLRGLYADWLQEYNKKKRQRRYEDLMYRWQIKKEYFGVLEISQDDFYKIKENITEEKAGIVLVGDKYFKLNAKQWELCNAIRNGEIYVSTIDNDGYFLTENHDANNDDDLIAMGAASQKTKNRILVFSLRLLMLLAVSALLAGFFVGDEPAFSPQAWFTLVVRLLTLLSGVSTGLTTAKANIRIDVFVFKHKTDRNNEFLEDIKNNRWTPLSEEEKVKMEYEQQVKENEPIVENEPVVDIPKENDTIIDEEIKS